MQIHGPASHLDQIDVRLVPGRPGPFAIVSFGAGAELFLETITDADKLILAGVKAKALLQPARRALDPERDDWDGEELASQAAHPSAQDDAGRAIAADLDKQRGGTDAS